MLERLQRQGARLKVVPAARRRTAHPDENATSTIEMVRKDDFIISQPILNGHVLPLASHELIEVTVTGPDGCVTFETRAQGRFKTTSGTGKPFFGYRLDMPEELNVDERRQYHRVLVGYDVAPEATLRTPDCKMPIHAVVEDISAGGARLRCRNGADHLQMGQFGYLHLELPEPIGTVSTLVRICAVKPSSDEYATSVHLAFDRPIAELSDFIRQVDLRRTARIKRQGE
ncbi:MAG: PilZ domain-containing protein [Planctomycetota bacterium]